MKILVVDDDPVARKVLHAFLTQSNYDVDVVEDAEQGLEAMQEEDAPPIAIIDWQMPEMDGLELIRRLREHGGEHYTYVILLTSHSTRDDFVRGMEAGADDYLPKPLDREALKAKLIAAGRIVSLYRELRHQKSELERLNRMLYETGRIDKLTGVGLLLLEQDRVASSRDCPALPPARQCRQLQRQARQSGVPIIEGELLGDCLLRALDALDKSTECRVLGIQRELAYDRIHLLLHPLLELAMTSPEFREQPNQGTVTVIQGELT